MNQEIFETLYKIGSCFITYIDNNPSEYFKKSYLIESKWKYLGKDFYVATVDTVYQIKQRPNNVRYKDGKTKKVMINNKKK